MKPWLVGSSTQQTNKHLFLLFALFILGQAAAGVQVLKFRFISLSLDLRFSSLSHAISCLVCLRNRFIP